jgi:hypothetical protein
MFVPIINVLLRNFLLALASTIVILTMDHVLLPTPNPLNKLLSGSHQSIDESNHSFPPLSCSSIPTNPGYFASYSFFDHVQVPCVLFAGSAIGVKRHHGIIPFGEKDIDIACWSDDWVKDHTLIEATLDAIFPNWYVSLQGYYVPIKGSSHFLDIWLHGPSVNSIQKRKMFLSPRPSTRYYLNWHIIF